jgi:hypothetical protein
VLLHFFLSPPTDDGMKVCLHLEQDAEGGAPLQVWGENTEDMSMPSPLGCIYGPFAPDVLQGSPSAHADQPMDDLCRGTTVSGLMQGRIVTTHRVEGC